MARARRFFLPVVVVALAPAWTACSSSTDPTMSKALTAREAQVVAGELFAQLFSALGSNATLVRRTGLSTSSSGGVVFSRAASPGARPAYGTALTDSFSAPCPLGGSVAGTFTETDNVDANGTGTFAITSTTTPNGCAVSTGSRTVTVNGAPSITTTVSVPLVAYVQSGVSTFQMRGGFAYDGVTCQLNYTVSIAASGHGTISGSVCGQDVGQTI